MKHRTVKLPGRRERRWERLETVRFTLIELLVVVSIIAILAAILLPALSRAREAALRTVCTSQNKQVVLAAFMYTDDNNGQFPNVDGSWLDRAKKGAYNPEGMGMLFHTGYLHLDAKEVELVFCPAADPSWNWRQTGHLLSQLGPKLGENPDAYATTVGKFCTFVGYNTATSPTRANLYLGRSKQTAAKYSPILTMDYIFDHGTPAADERQGHRGQGSPGGFYDGSVRWIDFTKVYDTGSPGYGGIWNNRNPYGNFWHWAKREYGE